MLPDDQTGETPLGNAQRFATTHWTVVLAAAANESPAGQAALEQLCQTYWYPLYAFLRHREGKDHATAKDLTQEFFGRLLRLNSLSQVQREKGKFRTFLLTSLKNFLLEEKARAGALKRGGGKTLVSLDDTTAEDRYQHEPANDLDPEQVYALHCAQELFERAGRRLREEYCPSGKSELYQELRPSLEGKTSAPPYAELADRLGCPEGTVKADVSRLRKRFRELITEEVALTVSPAEIDEEFCYLHELLSRWGTNRRA